MESYRVSRPEKPLAGTLAFPGDKSLSHRAVIFGALAEGESHFTNVLSGEDCVCTRKAFEAMGVSIRSNKQGTELWIKGAGLHGLKAPKGDLYLGNSGTSMRLLMGVLAGQPFSATLTGDPSLSSRPMRRVGDWLRRMGATIEGRDGGNFAPLTVKGAKLTAIDAALPMASAQVKSAILLAGLYAEGRTRVTEPEKSRDHSEKFLEFFDASVQTKGLAVTVDASQRLKAGSFEIAGDISSAAFFLAAAALLPGSALRFESVLWNPTRIGIVEVLKRMGARVENLCEKAEGPEMVADFTLGSGLLKAFDISKKELPTLIDEIPVLCVLATQAQGTSVIHDADELRVKESDRIKTVETMLTRLGAKIRSEGNTIFIDGPTPLRGAEIDSFKDHRIAMAAAVAGLVAQGETVIRDTECTNTSFPGFWELLKKCGAPVVRLTPP